MSPKRKRPSHDGLFLFGSPCYGENQYGFAVYCDGHSPSPFREFEPSNFAIATGRLTSEAFSESSGSRHKVAHSSRIVANYHLGTLNSVLSLLCGENFGKNNSQLFLSSFPSSGSHKRKARTNHFGIRNVMSSQNGVKNCDIMRPQRKKGGRKYVCYQYQQKQFSK